MNKYDKQHLKNLRIIEKQVDALYEKAAQEATRIGVSLRGFNHSKPFTFKDYAITEKKAEKLLQWLHKGLMETITGGINTGWALSNQKNDNIADTFFGQGVPNILKRQYYNHNGDAEQAFLERVENGMNLSDRVWRYTDEFKKEIELGLDLGIRTGRSADQISRDLRIYLQHPDKLFHDVRTKMLDEDGKPIWRKSHAAEAYHPGRGVYRSSYKNARRLAVTETNMAYRASDHARWQQMDFIVGQHVLRSARHDSDGITDICDELSGRNEEDKKGRYPKDFKFTGWHPLCRCFVVPLLADENEFMEHQEGKTDAENYDGEVKKMPKEFNKWVKDNKGRIKNAEQLGRLPYFLKDNLEATNAALAKSPLEIAKVRHANRTPEQAKAIQDRWDARKALNGYKEFGAANGTKKFNSILAEAQQAYREGKDGQLQGALAELKYRQSQIEAKTTKPKTTANTNKEPLIDLGNTKEQKGHIKKPERFNEDEDANAWENRIKQIMKDTGVNEAKAKDYASAIAHYSGEEYVDIRKWLAGERGFVTEGYDLDLIQKWAEDCEDYIHAAPKWKGGLTQRGMCMSQEGAEELIEQLKQGNAEMRGCSSWSTKESKAMEYAEDGLGDKDWKGRVKDTRIVLQTEEHVKATSIQHLSIHNTIEAEVLASMIERYEYISQVEKIYGGEKYIYIRVKSIITK